MSRRSLGLAASAACALLVVSCASKTPPGGLAPSAGGQNAQKAPQKIFVVAGTVTDSSGLPVRGLGVEILASGKPLLADPRLNRGAFQVAAKGQSGADGVYRLEFSGVPLAKRYYLNFYVPGSFDEVRFTRPGLMDITKVIDEKAAFLFDYRLPTHPK
ncbi:MAG: hypothetical protein O2807_14490, partial [bacterium]|nr:hypothetical protein [bacterium]